MVFHTKEQGVSVLSFSSLLQEKKFVPIILYALSVTLRCWLGILQATAVKNDDSKDIDRFCHQIHKLKFHLSQLYNNDCICWQLLTNKAKNPNRAIHLKKVKSFSGLTYSKKPHNPNTKKTKQNQTNNPTKPPKTVEILTVRFPNRWSVFISIWKKNNKS